jgi:hypothetical protein
MSLFKSGTSAFVCSQSRCVGYEMNYSGGEYEGAADSRRRWRFSIRGTVWESGNTRRGAVAQDAPCTPQLYRGELQTPGPDTAQFTRG